MKIINCQTFLLHPRKLTLCLNAAHQSILFVFHEAVHIHTHHLLHPKVKYLALEASKVFYDIAVSLHNSLLLHQTIEVLLIHHHPSQLEEAFLMVGVVFFEMVSLHLAIEVEILFHQKTKEIPLLQSLPLAEVAQELNQTLPNHHHLCNEL